ncbi:MAG: DsbA family protein [Anaeromyxobacteraceae bacterium]
MKFSTRPYLAVAAALGALACTSPSTTQAKAAAAPPADPNAPVAKVGADAITAKELEEFAKGELKKLDQQYQEQLYQLKRQALDTMIMKRLVDGKAKAAGKSPDEYVQAEIMARVGTPTDAEIQQVYDAAKAQGRDLPPMNQVKETIVRFIQQQKAQAAAQAYYDKLKADAKVEILLPPYRAPRQQVEAKGPSRGPATAPITIVEFSDFECPYCSRAEETVSEVLRVYGDKIRVVYRDLPLPNHTNAPKAAEAAHCAGEQDKYWEMHAKLFANQRALDVAALKGYAKDLKLDQAKFDKCLDSGAMAAKVEEGKKAGNELGINGTPAFFVNGILISGAQPFDAFKEIIDAELAQK